MFGLLSGGDDPGEPCAVPGPVSDERHELNLYITGYDEDGMGDGAAGENVMAQTGAGDRDEQVMAATGGGDGAAGAAEQGNPGIEAEDSPTR